MVQPTPGMWVKTDDPSDGWGRVISVGMNTCKIRIDGVIHNAILRLHEGRFVIPFQDKTIHFSQRKMYEKRNR
ncbi:MAG: hypothetical protein WC763_06135 [Candidatus Paceibacterota bacterium]